MARPAVIFGGPSPEHDISILSGLQAARSLHDAGRDPVALYWSKNGELHAVPATLEAKDYVTGVPAKAEAVDLLARPGGGFVGEAGRFGKRRELDIAAVVNCCHGGPGEDGSLQAALDLAGVRYTGPGAAGAALGMDKLAFGGAIAAAGLPSLPRTVFTVDGPDPEFAGPYIVKPRFGGSSIGIEITDDLGTARALVGTSPHFRDGAVVEPYLAGSVDLNVSVRSWPKLSVSAVEKPVRKDASGRIYTYAEKYLGGARGPVVGAARAAGRHPRRGGRAHPHAGRAGRARRPGPGRAPHRLPLARRRHLGERDQHHSRGAGLVLLDRRGGLVRGAARRPARGGRQGTRALPARPRAPTAPRCGRPGRSPASSREAGSVTGAPPSGGAHVGEQLAPEAAQRRDGRLVAHGALGLDLGGGPHDRGVDEEHEQPRIGPTDRAGVHLGGEERRGPIDQRVDPGHQRAGHDRVEPAQLPQQAQHRGLPHTEPEHRGEHGFHPVVAGGAAHHGGLDGGRQLVGHPLDDGLQHAVLGAEPVQDGLLGDRRARPPRRRATWPRSPGCRSRGARRPGCARTLPTVGGSDGPLTTW